MELNSPNDAVVHSDGSIYFSDPWYGRMPVYGVERPRVLGFQGAIACRPAAARRNLLSIATCSINRTGCAFRPTRGSFTSTIPCRLIRVSHVKPDGTPRTGMLFAGGIKSDREPGVPDGMKCDLRGNVWVTGPGGVWVYAPGGELIGKVRHRRTRGQFGLGRAGFPDVVRVCHPFGLFGEDESDATHGAVHAREAAAVLPHRVIRAAAATLFAAATSAAGCRARSDPHRIASRFCRAACSSFRTCRTTW